MVNSYPPDHRMTARLVIGIILLALAALFLTVPVLPLSISLPGGRSLLSSPMFLFFLLLPGVVLLLAGVLTTGRPHWVIALGWTCLAAVALGAWMLWITWSLSGSPEWQQMMREAGNTDGFEFNRDTMNLRPPLVYCGLLLALGLGGLMAGWGRGANEAAPPEGSRPVGVTVLAWFLLVTSALGTVGILFQWLGFQREALEASSQAFGIDMTTVWAQTIVFQAFSFVCALFLLKGHNWARWALVLGLVIGWGVFYLQMPGFYHANLSLFIGPGVLWLVILVGVLFVSRPARAFFAHEPPAPPS